MATNVVISRICFNSQKEIITLYVIMMYMIVYKFPLSIQAVCPNKMTKRKYINTVTQHC